VRGDRWNVEINGRPVSADGLDKGYLRLRRGWCDGDRINLGLAMPVTFVTCDSRVACNAGRMALTRGPIVYCVEGVDHGGTIRDLRLPTESEPAVEYHPELLGGVTVLRGRGVRVDEAAGTSQPVPLVAVPYAVWGNRNAGEMDVWIQAAD
jgi:DUF1680 family protein